MTDVDEKINQAVQKRQEMESTFINKTKESLDAKMEESQEKREAHMNSLKTKLKDHVRKKYCVIVESILWCVILFHQLEHVEKVRLTNETQLQDIRKQIDEKLKSADEKRDEMLKQLQEKLRLHV